MMKPYGLGKRQVMEALQKGEIHITVYGIGKIGLPLAAVLADKGAKVTGYDINEKVVERVNSGGSSFDGEPLLSQIIEKQTREGRLNATTQPVVADVHIIIVPTLLKSNKPNLICVTDVAKKISSVLQKGDIVITESTMPPGSTEKLIPLLEESGLVCGRDFGLAHCPERIMVGTAIRDITKMYPKIIGCIDEKTKNAVEGIYLVVNSKGVMPISSIKTAECVKVFEGVYRYANIALANELALVCSRFEVDVKEVVNAANTQPYCHIHKPGIGVGGLCLPYYPHFIQNKDTKLIKVAKKINTSMPEYPIKLLKKSMGPIKNKSILVLGLAYRPGVKETHTTIYTTPAIDLIKKLKKRKAKVYLNDPIYQDDEIRKWGAIPTKISDIESIDALILFTEYEEYKNLDFEGLKERGLKVVVDGRNVLDKEKIKGLGIEYRGIGRH